MNLSTKRKQTHGLKRKNVWFTREEELGRGIEFGTDIHTSLCLKQTTRNLPGSPMVGTSPSKGGV